MGWHRGVGGPRVHRRLIGSLVDERTIRELARLLITDLPDVLADPDEVARLRDQLRRALADPSVESPRFLRRVLRRPDIWPWTERHRQARPDRLKSHLDEQDTQPARFVSVDVPEEVPVDRYFTLEVAITRQLLGRSAALRPFGVPREGAHVSLTLQPDGLLGHSDYDLYHHDLLVPPDDAERDSERVPFVLRAPKQGLYRPSVRVYVGGKQVGELTVQIGAGLSGATAARTHSVPVDDLYRDGKELTLDIVEHANHYQYRLLADGVTLGESDGVLGDKLMTMLRHELSRLATHRDYKGRNAYEHLVNLGLRLWGAALPSSIEDLLLERIDSIDWVTVASDLHTVPWEVLHPPGRSLSGGFLAERLPIMRRLSGGPQQKMLHLGPAAYVVPPNAPSDVDEELDAVRRILGGEGFTPAISELATLTDRLVRGDFGLLHLACHNSSRLRRWDSVPMVGGPFTPLGLEKAKAGTKGGTLAVSRPLVFFNACQTTGGVLDTRIDSWAANFVAAGAGAFVGSVWPVRTGSARGYAEVFYDALVHRDLELGLAGLAARTAMKDDEDPTWLAYAHYGNASARAART